MHEQPLVDFHQHAFPEQAIEWLIAHGLADDSGRKDGYIHIGNAVSGISNTARIPFPPSQYDPDIRVDDLDRLGIDVACVSLPPFLLAGNSKDEDFVISLISVANLALREWCHAHSERLIPLPTVPLGLSSYSRQVFEDLNIADSSIVSMGTWGMGAELNDEANDSLWAQLDADRRSVFIHPSRVSAPERHQDFWLTQLVGYPNETALAIAKMTFGGILERHDIPLILSHGGGALPSLMPRLDIGWKRKPQAQTIPHPPSFYLKRLYYDTATFSSAAVEYIAHEFGAAHIVLGTDWPFDLADHEQLTDGTAQDGNHLSLPLRQTGSQLLGRTGDR